LRSRTESAGKVFAIGDDEVGSVFEF